MFRMILIIALKFYRWVISPVKQAVFGPMGRCRFTPSCSAYALEAVQLHGAFRGGWMGCKRLCRCHPWGGFGFDPVPGTSAANGRSPETANSAPQLESTLSSHTNRFEIETVRPHSSPATG